MDEVGRGGSEAPVIMDSSKGPEFVRNAYAPAKVIDLTDAKVSWRKVTKRMQNITLKHCFQTQHRRTVTILLLNGTKVNVLCSPTTTVARQVFEAIVRMEQLAENFFLGLCALIGGDFVFLPHDLKIYKVLTVTLRLCSVLKLSIFTGRPPNLGQHIEEIFRTRRKRRFHPLS